MDGPLPTLAVVGGHDIDGTTLFVGRACHNGDFLPVKINPCSRSAYVSCEGYEIYKEHYEVLCGTGYSWIHCENGMIPMNAVSSGRTCNGEIVYIGRGRFDRSLTVGKVFRGGDCLYIPYGGRERRVHSYEVLVKDSFEPEAYVIPAETCDTGSYVIPAKTGYGYDSTGAQGYIVPAKIAGNFENAGMETKIEPFYGPSPPPPSYSGLYPQVCSSAPSLTPNSSVAGFLKHEASNASPYSPGQNDSGMYPPPTISPAPVRTVTEMPMPQPPPPYVLKEETALVQKKPPAFGFQVSLSRS